MSADVEKQRFLLPILLASVIVLLAVLATVMLQWSHVNVLPDPPKRDIAAIEFPATTSHLSVIAVFPKAAIAAQLESALPKTFKFDVNSGGVRAHGSPSRGPITVVNDVTGKRVSASTPVSGRVQVEKRVIFNISVGIDVSAGIRASLSPVITPKWTIDPQFGLSAQVNRAVAKTAIGDIDVTGHVQGPVTNAVNGVKGTAEAKLKEVLDVRKKVERLWSEMNSVHKLNDNPPTWLRITPRQVTFGQFRYTKDSIDSGLALDLETHVFLQDAAPDVLKSPLPDLRITGKLSDTFEISIPVEVSFSVLNEQLKAQLTKSPIDLPKDAVVAITDATISPYGAGILLTLHFSGKKGWFKSASGRLHVVGIPVLDVKKAELRVEQLEFTVETKNILVKAADWLAHASLLDAMASAAVFRLESELTKSKAKANEELDRLKKSLPKEIGANVTVTEISVDRLAFAEERALVLVKVKGKMSAQLKP
jgi:hypothetical protein